MIQYNKPGSLRFFGSNAAELFSREVELSFKGVMAKNMITDENDPMAGFTTASTDGRGWSDTMWTRDSGTFMRELVHWGYYGYACMLAENVIKLVRKNSEGFYTFPEYFRYDMPQSGSELDGTSTIVIGMVLLWERIDDRNPTRSKIEEFLFDEASPLEYIIMKLGKYPLIPGSGEFGGGCGIEGEFYNVVQNNLVRLALQAAEKMTLALGNIEKADIYSVYAEQISANMLKYLRSANDTWVWCINTQTLDTVDEVINSTINKGFGGINGVFSMLSDVYGLEPFNCNWEGLSTCMNTFDKLLAFPIRKTMFDKYGIWTQFDRFCNGYYTSPSYGHAYAAQVMLLSDRLDMAEKAIDFLAETTYSPLAYNKIDRESPYYFYERIYLPELAAMVGNIDDCGFNVFNGDHFDQGCGALNLVNVTEPIKVARLMAGIDDANPDELNMIPRIPKGWGGFDALNWPVLTREGKKFIDVSYSHNNGKISLRLKVRNGETIRGISIRLPADNGFKRLKYLDVQEINI